MMSTVPTDNKTTKGRMKYDSHLESTFLAALQKFGVFSANDPQTLQSIEDKDLVTEAIELIC